MIKQKSALGSQRGNATIGVLLGGSAMLVGLVMMQQRTEQMQQASLADAHRSTGRLANASSLSVAKTLMRPRDASAVSAAEVGSLPYIFPRPYFTSNGTPVMAPVENSGDSGLWSIRGGELKVLSNDMRKHGATSASELESLFAKDALPSVSNGEIASTTTFLSPVYSTTKPYLIESYLVEVTSRNEAVDRKSSAGGVQTSRALVSVPPPAPPACTITSNLTSGTGYVLPSTELQLTLRVSGIATRVRIPTQTDDIGKDPSAYEFPGGLDVTAYADDVVGQGVHGSVVKGSKVLFPGVKSVAFDKSGGWSLIMPRLLPVLDGASVQTLYIDAYLMGPSDTTYPATPSCRLAVNLGIPPTCSLTPSKANINTGDCVDIELKHSTDVTERQIKMPSKPNNLAQSLVPVDDDDDDLDTDSATATDTETDATASTDTGTDVSCTGDPFDDPSCGQPAPEELTISEAAWGKIEKGKNRVTFCPKKSGVYDFRGVVEGPAGHGECPTTVIAKSKKKEEREGFCKYLGNGYIEPVPFTVCWDGTCGQGIIPFAANHSYPFSNYNLETFQIDALAWTPDQAEPCPWESRCFAIMFPFTRRNLFVELQDFDKGSCKLVPMDRRQLGCFAADTQITMADGNTKAARDVEVGESVLNPVTGGASRVERRTVGPEGRPLVELAVGGRVLRITEKHPVPTQRGILPASQVLASDTVLGADGVWRPLDRVGRTATRPSRSVYNFMLRSDSERPDDHLLVADGMVSGDLYLQSRLERSGPIDADRGGAISAKSSGEVNAARGSGDVARFLPQQ